MAKLSKLEEESRALICLAKKKLHLLVSIHILVTTVTSSYVSYKILFGIEDHVA